jgi:hypothetical protein
VSFETYQFFLHKAANCAQNEPGMTAKEEGERSARCIGLLAHNPAGKTAMG